MSIYYFLGTSMIEQSMLASALVQEGAMTNSLCDAGKHRWVLSMTFKK